MAHRMTVGVWVGLFGCVAMATDLTKIPLCTAPGVQQNPAIDGNIVVWEDERGSSANKDIYGYSFSEPNELVICTKPGDQMLPSVSGSIVVWQDKRNDGGDIYGFDLRSREELVICEHSGLQINPRISGSIVVWQDNRAGNYDIYGYNLDSEEEFVISNGPAFEGYPAIDQPWVVWLDARNSGNQDIYAKNLQTQEEIAICTDPANQSRPAVSRGMVVWQDERNKSTSGFDLYGRQLPDGVEFVVCDQMGDQILPSIGGSMVVWEDRQKVPLNPDVYARDLETGILLAVDTDISAAKCPVVLNNRIVWQSNSDLFYADVVAPTVLTILQPNGGEMLLAGSAVDILWQTEGTPPEYIRIVYSADNGQTWTMITPGVPNTGVFHWEPLPDLDSTQCLVRIFDPADPLKTDKSDALFTVFPCDGALTADLNGDCFVNLGDFSVLATQWLQCGNPYDSQWCF